MIAISKKKLAGILVIAIALVLAITLPLTLLGSGLAPAPNEGFGIKGHYQIYVNGELVREGDNTIVHAGIDALGEQMGASETSQPAIFKYIAVGTDGALTTVGMTLLTAEIDRDEGSASVIAAGKVDSHSEGSWTLDKTWAATELGDGSSTYGIKEAGVFNDPTTDTVTMFCRQTFEVLNIDSESDSLKITWTFTLTGTAEET